MGPPRNLWESATEAVVDCIGALVLLALPFGLLLCSSGCATFGSTTPRIDGQDEAAEIAWHVYGRTDSPPAIRWVTGSALDCIDPVSGRPGFTIFEPDLTDEHPIRCREGFTMHFDWFLAAYHGEQSIADTAALHELEHVALARDGIFVGHHKRLDFYHLIDVAAAAVRAAGY